ncbi:DUF4062 domain-containing protein [Iocasia frigidifontis]|uniref:DUF4062 domain-containing protein n=1 Tax=Iocasia fonsfrigidae TaxID=2682810 RepID=A0A8A7K9D2_9FIRM|nr:DUF4062 domain-containing protein [Iocasia fonsfrigidae]QTL97820.1 DUF4062 domain-containing protein [Iocasia fonsfrigidae]
MQKRYQIFLSSTFSDLVQERKAVIESLLNAKYIPAGMEMFSASNNEQFKYIKKIIDNCDYYVLIIAARYGSINPSTGISYTEQEYEYALSKNIPVLAFLHNDPYNLPSDKRDDDKREKLEAFRNKVSKNRMCKMWSTAKDLVSSVLISLTEETSENPQLGWIRGSSYDTTELLEQINNLRIENDNLSQELKELQKQIKANKPKVENLACRDDVFEIKGSKYKPPRDSFSKGRYLSHTVELTWDEIFKAIGPFLVSAKNYLSFSSDLKNSINSAYNTAFSSIKDDCIQTIKVQLSALGLINVRAAKSTNGGLNEFISLTEKGSAYLLKLKSIKKKKTKNE